ncbi:site-specific integrase [Streptomyces venezuelae]|uniref:Site-specific integrase n=1 Tax=Streptomyces venezuelae TaxID=54571 RepID=A0A5P2BV38_STRVZ|nr:site-specific integrase [Streptomyces venezuelae]
MAGHVQDRWYKTEPGADGKNVRVKTDRHGVGQRYRARYVAPDGSEKSKSFPDGQKRLAEKWLTDLASDMSRGNYVDPRAARITFKSYAEKWLQAHTADVSSRIATEQRLRLHAFPILGSRPLDSFRPEHIRKLVSILASNPAVSGGYARNIYGDVRAILSAAVDDGLLPRNPCSARSVRPPSGERRRVVPWLPSQVSAVRAALSERYRAMVDAGSGCGLRQGEIVGLAEDAFDFRSATLRVVRQVKLVRGTAVFAPPKGNKERDVPLPRSVAESVRVHMGSFKPVEIALPWRTPDGPLVSARLLFTNAASGIVWRSNFNIQEWKPALAAAGLIPEADADGKYQSAREHGMHALRHFYASVLLDAGVSVKAVSHHLGHSDPGLTLRVYAHLMPSSDDRTRAAIERTAPMPLAYDVRSPLDIPSGAFRDGVVVFHVHGSRYGGQWLLGAMTTAKGPAFGKILTAASTNPDHAVDTADAWVRAYCDSHGLELLKAENLKERFPVDQRPYQALARYLVARVPKSATGWSGLEG